MLTILNITHFRQGIFEIIPFRVINCASQNSKFKRIIRLPRIRSHFFSRIGIIYGIESIKKDIFSLQGMLYRLLCYFLQKRKAAIEAIFFEFFEGVINGRENTA